MTLKELNDREEIDFSGFIGNLKTHEMGMKVHEEREPPMKKSTAFKATPSIANKKKRWMKEMKKTLPCSLGKLARCSIRKEG